ncbi:MAG: hypothetical protein ACODAQ_01205, partial [Phycisphaeraceae bacterium]
MSCQTDHTTPPNHPPQPASLRWRRNLRGVGVATAVIMAVMALGDPLLAQEDEPSLQAKLDVEALLTRERVLDEQAEGPVWTVTPQPGRRLIHVPIRFEQPEAELDVRQPPVELDGGFFIAWHIQPREPEPQTGLGRRGDRRDRSQRRDMGRGMDMDMDRAPFPPEGAAPDPQMIDPSSDSAPRVPAGPPDNFPPDAPHFTREITLLPNGRVRWELDRNIPRAEVQEGEQAWRMKLRPGRFRELFPEAPERPRDRSADVQRQWRADMVEHRDVVRELREFQRGVMDLQDVFEIGPRPQLWAVISVFSSTRELTFLGDAPLPWTIAMDDLRLLREQAASEEIAGDGELARMNELAATGHPLTLRALAHALHRTDTGAEVESGTPVYRLLETIVRGDDDLARQRVLRDLARAAPPSRAALQLLREAAPMMDPQTKLLSLRSLLRADLSDTQRQREVIETTNRLLADQEGPAPAGVLQVLTEQIGEDSPLLLPASHNIDLAALPEDRRDAAIAYTIGAAGRSPLAANWIDHRLLGTNEHEVVHRTLDLLARADTGPNAVTPIVEGAFDLLFERRASAQETDQPDVMPRVEVPIPIPSENHALYRILNSGNEDLRRLAWEALPMFRVPDEAGDSERQQYEQVLDAALEQPRTPPKIVTFLDHQPDGLLAATGLLRVALDGDEQAAQEASRALHGSGRPIGEALLRLEEAERNLAARELYEALMGEAPLTVGLMRGRDSERVVEWFGAQVAAGQLPDSKQWARVYDEEQLVSRIGSSDPELARGAVAALVAQAGGAPDAAQELAARFANQSDRSTEAMRESWRQAKRNIYARR